MDEGRAVAERGSHEARLAAEQLLVHVQSHRGRRVGEAQRRAGEGREKRENRLNWMEIIVKNISCKGNEAKQVERQWINGLFWIAPHPRGQSDRRWCGNAVTTGLPANPCQ